MVRDRTEPPAAGRYNICYVNGFQTQPNEKGFWRQHRGLLLRDADGRPVVDEAWGETLLDLRTPAKRKALARIVGRWVRGCARHGYDAVEYDNLDSYTRSDGLIEAAQGDPLRRRFSSDQAHRSGLAAGQKNLAGFDGTRIGYDFAVAEECGRYDECQRYVDDFGDQVLMIEYRTAGLPRDLHGLRRHPRRGAARPRPHARPACTAGADAHTTELGDSADLGEAAGWSSATGCSGRAATSPRSPRRSEPAQRHRVTLVDMPDHGQSPWSDHFDYVAAADQVAELLSADDPVALVGHSMGGKISMLVALRHPELVERLVVVDVAPVPYDHATEFDGYITAMRAIDLDTLERRSEADDALREAVPDPTVRGFLLQSLRHEG